MRKEDREYASLHYAQGEGRGRQGSGRLSRGVYSAAPRRSGTFSAEAATLGTRELNDSGKTPEVIRTAPVMPGAVIRHVGQCSASWPAKGSSGGAGAVEIAQTPTATNPTTSAHLTRSDRRRCMVNVRRLRRSTLWASRPGVPTEWHRSRPPCPPDLCGSAWSGARKGRAGLRG